MMGLRYLPSTGLGSFPTTGVWTVSAKVLGSSNARGLLNVSTRSLLLLTPSSLWVSGINHPGPGFSGGATDEHWLYVSKDKLKVGTFLLAQILCETKVGIGTRELVEEMLPSWVWWLFCRERVKRKKNIIFFLSEVYSTLLREWLKKTCLFIHILWIRGWGVRRCG